MIFLGKSSTKNKKGLGMDAIATTIIVLIIAGLVIYFVIRQLGRI